MRTNVTLILWVSLFLSPGSFANEESIPRYKPSSRSPAPMDIRTNAYGASRDAPSALQIGDLEPDFSAPKPGGGLVSLRAARKQGPVVLVFYRGHW